MQIQILKVNSLMFYLMVYESIRNVPFQKLNSSIYIYIEIISGNAKTGMVILSEQNGGNGFLNGFLRIYFHSLLEKQTY